MKWSCPRYRQHRGDACSARATWQEEASGSLEMDSMCWFLLSRASRFFMHPCSVPAVVFNHSVRLRTNFSAKRPQPVRSAHRGWGESCIIGVAAAGKAWAGGMRGSFGDSSLFWKAVQLLLKGLRLEKQSNPTRDSLMPRRRILKSFKCLKCFRCARRSALGLSSLSRVGSGLARLGSRQVRMIRFWAWALQTMVKLGPLQSV